MSAVVPKFKVGDRILTRWHRMYGQWARLGDPTSWHPKGPTAYIQSPGVILNVVTEPPTAEEAKYGFVPYYSVQMRTANGNTRPCIIQNVNCDDEGNVLFMKGDAE